MYTLLIFIYLLAYLAVLGLCCCTRVSLGSESRGYSLVAEYRLLTAVASLAVPHRP